jgi:hypothetical protein
LKLNGLGARVGMDGEKGELNFEGMSAEVIENKPRQKA